MKKILLAVMALCSVCILKAQQTVINPTPQKTSIHLQEQAFEVPSSYTLIVDKQFADSYATKRLGEILPCNTKSAAFKIIIGKRGDKSLKAYSKSIPLKAEGYYLHISNKQIVIAAHDERGAFYGVETLKQLIADGKLFPTTIEDYPDVAYRGVVEGFYGTPWSHSARLRQLDFYGENKMNVYIYGPKDDPYHSVPNWRNPYPAKEAEQIKELVTRAHENGVIFYWAIHPGGDIKWNDTDRNLLVQKFESMYKLGVRAFAVFFDDIGGEGTKADRQAELLNYLDNEFVQKKKDVAPLVMCPTEYNKAWSNVKGGYLTTLGKKLNKAIQIMWTGNSVIACIDKPSMEWINPLIERNAYIWWNFPVSDYVRDHLLLGPVYGNGLDIKDDLSGFVSNPMERAEASKIALYSVADYAWNLSDFNSEKSWEHSLENLLPKDYTYLKTFASHSSDLGQNGHGFRRDESVKLQTALQALLNSKGTDGQAAMEINEECDRLSMASDILLVNKENPYLIDEIRPWIKQAKFLGEYGQDVIAMLACLESNKSADFLLYYTHAKALQIQMYELDSEDNKNPYQPGVKVGSKILLPTLNKLYTIATSTYNHREGTTCDTLGEYKAYTLRSTVPQLAMQPILEKGKNISISPSNEVITWAAGQFIEITADKINTLNNLSFDLGTPSIASSFRLETTENGTDWKTAELLQPEDKNAINTTNAIQGVKAIKLRLTNVSGKELKVFLRNFKIGKQ
ncbi:MAG: beta-N-acetylglucosaminidase [Bacteroidaceae bacterium]